MDVDGRLDIGFPGPSSGQVTVDWVRWGNEVILDLTGPEAAASPKLNLARVADGVQINWTGGGTLQSASEVTGPWTNETSLASGAKLATTAARTFYRVKL